MVKGSEFKKGLIREELVSKELSDLKASDAFIIKKSLESHSKELKKIGAIKISKDYDRLASKFGRLVQLL